MPQAIPVIVGLVGSAGTAAAVTAFVGGLLKQAALTFLARVLSKKHGAGAPPVNVTIRATVAERRICLGTVRASGVILFVNTSGTKNKYLWIVVAYAGHQCSDVKDLWLDKYKVADADINAGTGAVSTTQLDGKLFCWTYLGTSAQTADPNLDAAFTEWTSNHRLRGICYRVLRLERSTDAWPNGAPQSFTSLVDGALSYDPRLDTTAGGAGSHRSDDPSTWAFTRNWALNTRWVLSGGSVINDDTTRLIKYGVRETDARIDDAYITAAANLSDQSLSGGNAPPSGAQARYTLDIELSCGQTRREWLEECLAAGGPGQLVMLHGEWRLYGAAYDAPSHTMTQDDLHGELEDDCTSGSEDRFNQISAVYIDETKDWTEQTTPIRTNAAYVTQDNGEKILHKASLRGVTNEYRAQRVIEVMLRNARQMRVVRFPFGRQGMKIAPWETFTFDHTAFGWSAKLFRCVERELVRTESGGLICMITARQETSSVYTDLVTADYTSGTSVTNALQSEPPDDPTALRITPIPGGIEFEVEIGSFWYLHGTVELWEYSAATPFASATKVAEFRGNRYTLAKKFTDTNYYWVTIRASGGQTSGEYPAGNGLPGSASFYITQICPDADFLLATDETHWWVADPSGGTSASIANTGGNVAGIAGFGSANVGQPHYLVSRPRLAYGCATGEIYTITVRAVRTGASFTGNLVAGIIRHDQDGSASTFNWATAEVCVGGLTLSQTSVTPTTTEFIGLCMVSQPAGYAGGDLPFLSAYIGIENSNTAAAFRVDFVKVSPGAGTEPYPFTITAGATLTVSELFSKCIYDSALGGTVTLPAASADYLRARIYFEQSNTGLLTIAPAGGETLQSSPNTTGNRALAGRYARAYAEVIAASVWRLVGDL